MKRYIKANSIPDEYGILRYIPKRYHEYIKETDAVADFDNSRNRTVTRYYVYFTDGEYVSAIGLPGIKNAVVKYLEKTVIDGSSCIRASEDKTFIVKYIDKNDRTAEDRVHAKNVTEARKIVKPRAYRILDVHEEK